MSTGMITTTATPYDSSQPHDAHASIRAAFASSSSSSPPRPILIHLTPDSSWLLSLPVPNSSTSVSSSTASARTSKRKRTHYNILIDPWLSGPQIDFNPLFSHQTHATEAAIPTIAALEELLLDLEYANTTSSTSSSSSSSSSSPPDSESRTTPAPPAGHPSPRYSSSIDAIVLSHEFTDHTHHDTLIQCSPSVPVLATTKAAGTVRGWGHFDSVCEVPEMPLPGSVGGGAGAGGGGTGTSTPGEWRKDGDGVEEELEGKDNEQENGWARNIIDWRAVTHPPNTYTPLPSWLGVTRLVEERRHDIVGTRLHSAIMIVFDLSSSKDKSHAESLIYTPHGIPSTSSIISLLSPASPPKAQSQAAAPPTLSPPIKPLLLLHGLHAVTISGARINLGGHNGAALARSLGVKYWIRTHDEVKDGRGLVGWLLKRRRVGWGEALGLQFEEEGGRWLGNGVGDGNGDGQGKEGAKTRETERGEGKEEEEWDRREDADGVVLTRSNYNEEKVDFFNIGNGECRVLT